MLSLNEIISTTYLDPSDIVKTDIHTGIDWNRRGMISKYALKSLIVEYGEEMENGDTVKERRDEIWKLFVMY